MVAVATFWAVLGTTIPTATFGLLPTRLPKQVIGTWTDTKILRNSHQPGSLAVTVETFTFLANGEFQHSSLTNLSLPTDCKQIISLSQEGKAITKDSSTLRFITKPGTITVQDSCNPTKTRIIPTSSGTMTWKRQNDFKKGEQLCLFAYSLHEWRGTSTSGCYYQ
jgi:hypothetical protein